MLNKAGALLYHSEDSVNSCPWARGLTAAYAHSWHELDTCAVSELLILSKINIQHLYSPPHSVLQMQRDGELLLWRASSTMTEFENEGCYERVCVCAHRQWQLGTRLSSIKVMLGRALNNKLEAALTLFYLAHSFLSCVCVKCSGVTVPEMMTPSPPSLQLCTTAALIKLTHHLQLRPVVSDSSVSLCFHHLFSHLSLKCGLYEDSVVKVGVVSWN